jgi:predicted O-linked N-acetylglucosamine transferase (SPINDLY family)
MQVLKDTPKSVLWLGEVRHSVRIVLRGEAKARGIDEDRLVFANLSPREQHLARLSHADLYLDTLTFQDASPVHDALSAGLPVLSHAGRSYSARAGASLVSAAGLAGLVTATPAEFVAAATRIGGARKEAQDLRHKLKAEMGSNPLFNQGRFLDHLQRAFEMIIERSRTGAPAASFDVPA